MLLDMPHIPPSYCYRCPWGLTYPSCGIACATELETAILAAGPERVAAFIAEPVVASVGGAIWPVGEYWPMIREICDRYGVLLIADEVVTGFGRTGRDFAVDHWGVVPDLLVMGKGISGGYAPLGAVAIRTAIRTAFEEHGAAFEHIFTFGGNPVAAAAGLAVLDVWERERLTDHVAELAPGFTAALEPLRRLPFVGDVRTIGFMAGIELVADRETRRPFPPAARVAVKAREAGLRAGIVTYPGTGMAEGADGRPAGDIISLYPPLTFQPSDIAEMGDRLADAFTQLGRELDL
jgi:adenosylmethionine-8-amino-7-oxononanoate aminotransferase